MNVSIRTFKNPFSFFCVPLEEGRNNNNCLENVQVVQSGNVFKSKIELADVTHGQYVAVLWNNKWMRGLVTMESQFLIWLIDYGIFLRPNDKTVYIDLPPEHKKYPSKVFEASLHGVTPVDKALTEECGLKNEITNIWNAGSIEKAQTLIASANQVFFVPIALMTTKFNDIVLGDLYLVFKEKGVVNIIDELEMWPVFLERNKAAYIDNLATHYNTSRRKHRTCLLKPAFIADFNLPTMQLKTTYAEYCAICNDSPQFELLEQCDALSGDGSTVLEYSGGKGSKDKSLFKLTPSEIQKYSNMYITVCGREYNVLNVLINKTRDLKMCEMYKDHDLKSVGRASYRSAQRNNHNSLAEF